MCVWVLDAVAIEILSTAPKLPHCAKKRTHQICFTAWSSSTRDTRYPGNSPYGGSWGAGGCWAHTALPASARCLRGIHCRGSAALPVRKSGVFAVIPGYLQPGLGLAQLPGHLGPSASQKGQIQVIHILPKLLLFRKRLGVMGGGEVGRGPPPPCHCQDCA